jgi:hypothetical protein
MTPKKALFVVFVCLLTPNYTLADPVSKGHKTPHGGTLQEGGGIHAEFLIDKAGQPKVYLYDKTMKPLARKDLKARLMVKGHDGSQHSQNLKISSEPAKTTLYLGRSIKGLSDWDMAVVSLKLKEQWVHIRFSHH